MQMREKLGIHVTTEVNVAERCALTLAMAAFGMCYLGYCASDINVTNARTTVKLSDAPDFSANRIRELFPEGPCTPMSTPWGLYVRKEYRDRGIGKELMRNHLLSIWNSYSHFPYFEVEVNAYYKSARFYENFFRTQDDFYADVRCEPFNYLVALDKR